MRIIKVLPALARAAGLALAAGCGTAHSVPPSDAAAAKHIATQVLNTCVSTLGGKPQATGVATMEQPKVQNALLTHSGRKAFESCLKQHASHHAVHKILLCVGDEALNAGNSLCTQAGKQAFANAAFNCLAVNLQ